MNKLFIVRHLLMFRIAENTMDMKDICIEFDSENDVDEAFKVLYNKALNIKDIKYVREVNDEPSLTKSAQEFICPTKA